MACAGSSGGSQPPHRHPYRLPGQCEQDDDDIQEMGGEWIPPPPPPKRKQGERGSAKGLKVQALKQKLGGPIPIIWDPRFPIVGKAVGEHSANYDSELGKIIRNNVPVHSEKWSKVSPQLKQLIWKEAQASFGPLDETHRPAVMSQCAVLLRKWKRRCGEWVEKHVDAKKPGPPPKFRDVDSQEEWDQYLRYIATPKFKDMSNRNKKNRAKLPYVGTQGRRSMPGHRFYRLTMNNLNQVEEIGEDPIEVWADKHRKNGKFVNAEAEADYNRVIEVARRLAPDGLLTYELERQIFEEALGTRRDYLKGLGPTFSSQSATSSHSSQSPSSSTVDSKQYAQLERKVKKTEAKMQRFMAAVKAHIPDLMDAIEESSDDSDDVDEDMDVGLDDV